MEQDERQALLQLLQNSNAFGGLPSELLEQLIAAMSKKRIAAKVRLFAEGSFADRCLVLAKGTIDVKRGSTTAFAATSGIYNEMGVVFKCRCSATIVTKSCATVYEITRARYHEMLRLERALHWLPAGSAVGKRLKKDLDRLSTAARHLQRWFRGRHPKKKKYRGEWDTRPWLVKEPPRGGFQEDYVYYPLDPVTDDTKAHFKGAKFIYRELVLPLVVDDTMDPNAAPERRPIKGSRRSPKQQKEKVRPQTAAPVVRRRELHTERPQSAAARFRHKVTAAGQSSDLDELRAFPKSSMAFGYDVNRPAKLKWLENRTDRARSPQRKMWHEEHIERADMMMAETKIAQQNRMAEAKIESMERALNTAAATSGIEEVFVADSFVNLPQENTTPVPAKREMAPIAIPALTAGIGSEIGRAKNFAKTLKTNNESSLHGMWKDEKAPSSKAVRKGSSRAKARDGEVARKRDRALTSADRLVLRKDSKDSVVIEGDNVVARNSERRPSTSADVLMLRTNESAGGVEGAARPERPSPKQRVAEASEVARRTKMALRKEAARFAAAEAAIRERIRQTAGPSFAAPRSSRAQKKKKGQEGTQTAAADEEAMDQTLKAPTSSWEQQRDSVVDSPGDSQPERVENVPPERASVEEKKHAEVPKAATSDTHRPESRNKPRVVKRRLKKRAARKKGKEKPQRSTSTLPKSHVIERTVRDSSEMNQAAVCIQRRVRRSLGSNARKEFMGRSDRHPARDHHGAGRHNVSPGRAGPPAEVEQDARGADRQDPHGARRAGGAVPEEEEEEEEEERFHQRGDQEESQIADLDEPVRTLSTFVITIQSAMRRKLASARVQRLRLAMQNATVSRVEENSSPEDHTEREARKALATRGWHRRNAAVLLQRFTRMSLAVRRLADRKAMVNAMANLEPDLGVVVVMIQCMVRKRLARHRVEHLRSLAHARAAVLQYRAHGVLVEDLRMAEVRNSSAVEGAKLSSTAPSMRERGLKRRRAALALQRVARRWLARNRVRRIKAANVVEKNRLRQIRPSATAIQRIWRRILATQRVLKRREAIAAARWVMEGVVSSGIFLLLHERVLARENLEHQAALTIQRRTRVNAAKFEASKRRRHREHQQRKRSVERKKRADERNKLKRENHLEIELLEVERRRAEEARRLHLSQQEKLRFLEKRGIERRRGKALSSFQKEWRKRQRELKIADILSKRLAHQEKYQRNRSVTTLQRAWRRRLDTRSKLQSLLPLAKFVETMEMATSMMSNGTDSYREELWDTLSPEMQQRYTIIVQGFRLQQSIRDKNPHERFLFFLQQPLLQQEYYRIVIMRNNERRTENDKAMQLRAVITIQTHVRGWHARKVSAEKLQSMRPYLAPSTPDPSRHAFAPEPSHHAPHEEKTRSDVQETPDDVQDQLDSLKAQQAQLLEAIQTLVPPRQYEDSNEAGYVGGTSPHPSIVSHSPHHLRSPDHHHHQKHQHYEQQQHAGQYDMHMSGLDHGEKASDWERHFDPNSGKYYYSSTQLGKSVWAPLPAEALLRSAPTNFDASETDTSDWEAGIDPESGDLYYYSERKRRSTWTPPQKQSSSAKKLPTSIPEGAESDEALRRGAAHKEAGAPQRSGKARRPRSGKSDSRRPRSGHSTTTSLRSRSSERRPRSGHSTTSPRPRSPSYSGCSTGPDYSSYGPGESGDSLGDTHSETSRSHSFDSRDGTSEHSPRSYHSRDGKSEHSPRSYQSSDGRSRSPSTRSRSPSGSRSG